MGIKYATVQVLSIVLVLVNISDQVCVHDKTLGTPSVDKVTHSVDTKSGQLYLLHQPGYSPGCCGLVTRWHVYISHPGTVRFQVWRPLGTGEYKLVGENMATYHSGEEKNKYFLSVSEADQIAIFDNDYIGWYNEGKPMITYNVEHKGQGILIIPQSKPVTIGDTVDWSKVHATNARKYALSATVSKTEQPTFLNLNSEITFEEELEVNRNIFTIMIGTKDKVLISALYVIYMETVTKYFTFNASTKGVYVAQPPPPGRHVLHFIVKEPCGKKQGGKLELRINTKYPTIANLPSTTVVKEDVRNKEVLLKVIRVVQLEPATCSIRSVKPSHGARYFLIRGTNVSEEFNVYLKSSAELDYKKEHEYELEIKCDSGGKSDVRSLMVSVTPNEAPTYTNLPSNVSLSTDKLSIDDVIFHIETADYENNVIYYNMSCDTSKCPFEITNDGNIILEQDPVTILSTVYFLNVYLSDYFNTAGPETLTVLIDGVNKAPQILNMHEKSLVLVNVFENSPVGSSIFQPEAIDHDANDVLIYTLDVRPSSFRKYFTINGSTGLITVQAPIDFESFGSHNVMKLVVHLTDGKMKTQGSLKAAIVNVNEPPNFTYDTYTVFVDEGRPGATIKAKIKATDPDKDDDITFRLDCGNDTNLFQINDKNAEITQTYGLDVDELRLLKREIVCNVTAIDKGGLRSAALVRFIISDSDDNSPLLQRTSYLFAVTRDMPVYSIIGIARANDPDTSSSNNRLFYAIDDDTDHFVCDDNGTIYLAKDLSNTAIGTLFRFTVIAHGGGKTADKASVTIIVLTGNYSMLTSPIDGENTSFFDLPENAAWFTAAMLILLFFIGLCIFIWTGVLRCKIERRRKSLFQNRVQSREKVQAQPNTYINNLGNNTKRRQSNAGISVTSLDFSYEKNGEEENKEATKDANKNTPNLYSSPISVASAISTPVKLRGTEEYRSTRRSSTPGKRSEKSPSYLSLSDIYSIEKGQMPKNPTWKPWAISDFEADLEKMSLQRNRATPTRQAPQQTSLNF